MKYSKGIFTLGLLVSFVSSSAIGGNLTAVPKIFVSEENALASEVNENFEAVRAEVDDNANSIKNKLDNIVDDCTLGSIQKINPDGSVLCSTPTTADITAVTAGAGLLGGGTSGDVALSVDPAVQTPPGIVSYFARLNCPAGWLKADGSEMLISDSPELAQDLQIIYGLGTVTPNTVILPDLRGEFIRGWNDRNDGLGPDTGRVLGSKQADELASHQHSVVEMIANNAIDGVDSATTFSNEHHNEPRLTGATGGIETRPRNVALLACIKI